MSRLTEAASSATGRGLILGGAAGIGKSRLLREGVAGLDPDRYALWSVTAGAATSSLPLGGLAQALPADHPAGVSPAGLLRWAVDSLLKEAAGRPIVLAIDDLHLLDPLSAALVYWVARSGPGTIVGTVRTGADVPDPIRALWDHDLVDRVELGPLTRPETADLLRTVLGGPVDEASTERLWSLSEGNALLLRELVLAGEMTETYGVWRWTGRFELAPTLTDVIDERIGQLTPEVRDVLELVSFGEPIGLRLLSRATDARAVEFAEERQLIRVQPESRRTTVRLAHPLYGEVVRRRCPLTRIRRLLAELANLVESTGCRRRDDLMRVAVWRLDSDTARDPQALLRACQQAFATFDIPLALRLGEAAVAAGGGADAAEMLATILMFADQPDEALGILDAVGPLIDNDRQRSRWLGIRAIVTYWGRADESTVDFLAAGAAALRDPASRAWVRAVETIMRLHHGELGAATRLAGAVLAEPASSAGTRALARSAMAHLRAASGRPAQSIEAVNDIEADAARWLADAPYIKLAVELARGTATILSGSLRTVDTMVAAEFAGMADAGEFHLASGYLTLIRAQAARLRGALDDAARYAGQASAMLSSGRVYAGLAHAERAHVAALMGDADTAEAAMAEADRVQPPTMAALYPWIEQARAWTTAVIGDTAGAIDILRRLGDRLRADSFAGHELFALNDLVRLGAADLAAERLDYLSDKVDVSLARMFAAQARFTVRHDGAGLLAVADEFVDHELYLYAAETAAAALVHLRANRSASATRAAAMLNDMRTRCPRAHTPLLDLPPPALTARELEIATLAAAGVASKQIADKLFLSPRTVDNHLMRVYAKLGVNGRAGLAEAMGTLPAE